MCLNPCITDTCLDNNLFAGTLKYCICSKGMMGNTLFTEQCKFMPLAGDRLIATCARDGQVRLTEVAEAVCRSTRRLARHTGPSHKLAMTPARPQVDFSNTVTAV